MRNPWDTLTEAQFDAVESTEASYDGVRVCVMRYAQVTKREAVGALKEYDEILQHGIRLKSFNAYVATEIIQKMAMPTDEKTDKAPTLAAMLKQMHEHSSALEALAVEATARFGDVDARLECIEIHALRTDSLICRALEVS